MRIREGKKKKTSKKRDLKLSLSLTTSFKYMRSSPRAVDLFPCFIVFGRKLIKIARKKKMIFIQIIIPAIM